MDYSRAVQVFYAAQHLVQEVGHALVVKVHVDYLTLEFCNFMGFLL